MTQYLHQNIKLEATPGVTTCVSKILQESTKGRHGHQAPGNWKQLDHQALGDWLLQRILQMKKKVRLHPKTHGEKYIRKFDDAAKNFKPQNEEEHELKIKY